LSDKEFQEDGAATANARLARCLCVMSYFFLWEVKYLWQPNPNKNMTNKVPPLAVTQALVSVLLK